MKRVFSMMVALATAIMGYSQSSLVATLNHNGEISTFYGATALQEAHDASQHGDAITLSSGTFTAVDITKALTIRGAGMQVDSIAQILPTIISGDFNIEISDSIEQHLIMEGIYNNNTISVKGTLKEASFQKCRLNNFTYSNISSTKMDKLTFVHCKITSRLGFIGFASCVNCYINNPRNTETSSSYDFLNCIIKESNTVSPFGFYNSNLTNCIVISNGYSLKSSNTVSYCLGTGASDIFKNVRNIESTIITSELSEIFKTYTGTYSDDETFELTDAAKVLYRGNDVKQVGMYGGNVPFNPNTTNPRIVKCNVASESTADGKLSVDIEVSAAK